jgi:hypothetical protein
MSTDEDFGRAVLQEKTATSPLITGGAKEKHGTQRHHV